MIGEIKKTHGGERGREGSDSKKEGCEMCKSGTEANKARYKNIKN